MTGWRHCLNGHKFEQTPGDSEGQGSLAAAVHAVAKVGYNVATEQQRESRVTAFRHSEDNSVYF